MPFAAIEGRGITVHHTKQGTGDPDLYYVPLFKVTLGSNAGEEEGDKKLNGVFPAPRVKSGAGR